MIHYTKATLLKPWKNFGCHGSPFPVSLPLALFAGVLSVAWALLFRHVDLGVSIKSLGSSDFNSFSVLVGFLIIFRTQQAYSRFWDSCNHVMAMQANYYMAASNLIAFCRHSSAKEEQVANFVHIIIRLTSLLNGVSLDRLRRGTRDLSMEFCAHEVIDWRGLDAESLEAISHEECKLELIMQWLQALTVDGIKHSIITIPPPILTRIFQNLGNGLVSWHAAARVAEIPFPWPYAQATEILLGVHFLMTPVVMAASLKEPLWAFLVSFFVVLTLTTLNTIATEMEDPFGTDPNDIDFEDMQHDMNRKLLMLMRPCAGRVPSLSELVKQVRATQASDMISQLDGWNQVEELDKNNSPARIGRSLQMPSRSVVEALCAAEKRPVVVKTSSVSTRPSARPNKLQVPSVISSAPSPQVMVAAHPALPGSKPAHQPPDNRPEGGKAKPHLPPVLDDDGGEDEDGGSSSSTRRNRPTLLARLEEGEDGAETPRQQEKLAVRKSLTSPQTQTAARQPVDFPQTLSASPKTEKPTRPRKTGKQLVKSKTKDIGVGGDPSPGNSDGVRSQRKGLLYVGPS